MVTLFISNLLNITSPTRRSKGAFNLSQRGMDIISMTPEHVRGGKKSYQKGDLMILLVTYMKTKNNIVWNGVLQMDKQ